MLNQKSIVQRIYLELVSDPAFRAGYLRDPERTLAAYGLDDQNARRLMRILSLFC